MKALITGSTGFVGSHLAEYLLSQGIEVFGTKRPRSRDEFKIDKVGYVEADITDPTAMKMTINKTMPDVIFHLAAQSDVRFSFDNPVATFCNNAVGTLILLEAVKELKPDTIIHIAGSSEEYGRIAREDLPTTEKVALFPQSQYAVSKIACDYFGQQYFYSYGLKTVITRAFNHEGPRRGENFAPSAFAKQIAEIEAGLKEPVLVHGNLESCRDYTDVRDMVKAYWLATRHCVYGEPYNICSGKTYRIGAMLNQLLEMSTAEIELRVDKTKMRPSDVPILLGSYKRFYNATGWKPEIPFEQTLKDLLNYWREKVAITNGKHVVVRSLGN